MICFHVDNKRLDEWVAQTRLNLEKVQLPKVEDKKKSSAASSASTSKSKSKLNQSKSKQQNNSQPALASSSSQPPLTPQQSESLPVVLTENDASAALTPAVNKNKAGNLFGRKRKANDEV